jgi:diguanylate cyclase (GGDEF)-like protein
MGGDEFVIVVPGLREELRWSYVERLQGVAHTAGWEVCSEQCISMSVGTAIYPFDGADAEVLLAEADRRMYTVKQQKHALMAVSNQAEPVAQQTAS